MTAPHCYAYFIQEGGDICNIPPDFAIICAYGWHGDKKNTAADKEENGDGTGKKRLELV
jgi:hypothetical protein